MRKLVVLALFGMAAQLVDGGLGMAYGLTTSTLLLAFGIAPAVASASVHLAEVGTTLASGLAHHRMGNTDWRVVRRLALPGAVGAFSGAVVLSNLNADAARPAVAVFLSVLGAYVLVRFAFLGGAIRPQEGSVPTKLLAPLGLVAGFLDTAGGGGWGPISTPTLLASGRMEPRTVVGTVGASEFLVAAAASVGFLISLDRSRVALPVVAALLVGGAIAAPMAALVVRHCHPRILGAAIGGLIVLTNARTLMGAAGLGDDARLFGYALLSLVWIVALAVAIQAVLAARRPAAAARPAMAFAPVTAGAAD